MTQRIRIQSMLANWTPESKTRNLVVVNGFEVEFTIAKHAYMIYGTPYEATTYQLPDPTLRWRWIMRSIYYYYFFFFLFWIKLSINSNSVRTRYKHRILTIIFTKTNIKKYNSTCEFKKLTKIALYCSSSQTLSLFHHCRACQLAEREMKIEQVRGKE